MHVVNINFDTDYTPIHDSKSTLAVTVCNCLRQQSCILTSLVQVKILLVVRGVSREGLRGLEHPPSLPDFTEILPICLQLLFLTFTFVLMTQYIRLYLCSVKEKMKL